MRSFFRVAALIAHFERRRVFRPGLAVIINPRRRNIRMPQPFLHIGDIGLMVERIGRRRRAERMRAYLETQSRRVLSHHPIHPVRRDGVAGRPVAAVVKRAASCGTSASGYSSFAACGGSISFQYSGFSRTIGGLH